MFFAGISIFILSGLMSLVILGLGSLMWICSADREKTKAVFGILRFTLSVTFIGGVLTVMGGGSL